MFIESAQWLTKCSDEATDITLEFYEKPSKREYPDYYRQITHPTSLKDIQKAVSNNKFPSWESFVTEVEYLWENAKLYNEEGSFIYENADKLRVCSILSITLVYLTDEIGLVSGSHVGC